MNINVIKTEPKEILPLRNLFLQGNNFQIRYNAYHERSWTDSYLLIYNNEKIGYGSIKGNENIEDRNTIFEFYVIPSIRDISSYVFSALLQTSKAVYIECQSNDLLLTSLLFQKGQNINSDVILFKDCLFTGLYIESSIFRKREKDDRVFEHITEPVGDYVLELNKEIVATGGYLLHYNMPFADLYIVKI